MLTIKSQCILTSIQSKIFLMNIEMLKAQQNIQHRKFRYQTKQRRLATTIPTTAYNIWAIVNMKVQIAMCITTKNLNAHIIYIYICLIQILINILQFERPDIFLILLCSKTWTWKCTNLSKAQRSNNDKEQYKFVSFF